MVTEKFTPQYFCAGCTITKNMIYSPVPETNNVPGFQRSDNGHGIDSDHYPWSISSQYLAVGDAFTVQSIRAEDDTYPNDNENMYWEIRLTANAEVYKKKGSTFEPTGVTYTPSQIFYHAYDFMNTSSFANSDFWFPKNNS